MIDDIISHELTRREWTIIQIILTASMTQDYMRELFLEDVKKIVDEIREIKTE